MQARQEQPLWSTLFFFTESALDVPAPTHGMEWAVMALLL
jgi:hypothetical protein